MEAKHMGLKCQISEWKLLTKVLSMDLRTSIKTVEVEIEPTYLTNTYEQVICSITRKVFSKEWPLREASALNQQLAIRLLNASQPELQVTLLALSETRV